MELHQALGEVIRQARVRQGLTQEAVAEKGVLDITYLRDLSHSRCNPSIDILDCVANSLGVELSSFIKLAKEKQSKGEIPLDTHE